MKTPRVHDFDPNAKVPDLASPLDNLPSIKPPVKQVIPTVQQELEKASHISELHEQSVFFKQPHNAERPNARTGHDSNAPTNERSNERRVIKRASYELFADQIEAIRRIALEDKMQGGKGNQSEMVRAAIDEYLQQKRGVK